MTTLFISVHIGVFPDGLVVSGFVIDLLLSVTTGWVQIQTGAYEEVASDCDYSLPVTSAQLQISGQGMWENCQWHVVRQCNFGFLHH